MPEQFLRFTLPFTSLALAVWVLYYPNPYTLCVVTGLLFPIVVLLVSRLRPSRFSLIDEKRGEVATEIGMAAPFGIISAALFVRAFIDFHFPDTTALLMWTGATALLVGLLLWVTIQGASLSIALLIGAFYSLPAVAFINASNSQTPPRSLPAKLVDKHSYTKPRLRTVVVTAEGQSHEIPVSEVWFAKIEAGSNLCLVEQYGLLRLRTVGLARCVQ
jgi:hypothetical protein